MEGAIKKDFILEGLCCGNCAAKIEKDVNKLDGVASASLDFVTKTLSLEVDGAANYHEILTQTSDIVKMHEPDIILLEKEKSDQKAAAFAQKASEAGPGPAGIYNKINAEGIAFGAGAVIFAIALLPISGKLSSGGRQGGAQGYKEYLQRPGF